MADDRTVLFSHQRQGESVGGPQGVNDSAFGLAAMLDLHEGGVCQSSD